MAETGGTTDISKYTNWFGQQFSSANYMDQFKGKENQAELAAKAAKNASVMGNVTGIASAALPLVDPVVQALGAKKADNISGGEQAFSQGTDLALNMALKTGNPWLIGGAAVLKGADWLNQYAGATNEKQGTLGLNTGPRQSYINTNAGKKETLFGTWMGKSKNANRLTNYYNKMNLVSGQSAYENQRSQLAAVNSAQDRASVNQQQVMGGLNTRLLVAKKGTKINPAELRILAKKAKRGIKVEEIIEVEFPELIVSEVEKFENGGKMNVIPEGALHARKHNIQGDLAKSVTDKGIPVVTFEEGGEITQHAEIEVNEIIFNKETTVKIEDFFKQYNDADSQSEKNKIAIECGRFLTSEILENTDDRTGLLNTIE